MRTTIVVAVSFFRQSFAFVNGEPSSFDLDLLGSDLLILAVITFSF